MKRKSRLLAGARFDYDRTRFCVPCRTGIACYRGMLDQSGKWTGKLVGMVGSESDAQRFLEGALVRLKTP